MKLSVIVPSFNYARYVGAQLESILNQNYNDFECLVFDDASTDDSVEIIKTIVSKDERVTFFEYKENIGAFGIVAQGIKISKGDYIYFASADDYVLPGYFREAMKLFEAFPQASLCSALSMRVDSENKIMGRMLTSIPLKTSGFISPDEAKKKLTLMGSWIAGNTTIFNKSIFLKEGGLPGRDLGSYSDAILSQGLALRYGCCYIPSTYGHWRELATGYSVSSLTNIEKSLNTLRAVTRYIDEKWQKEFPARYRYRWLRLQKYRIGRAATVGFKKNLILMMQFSIDNSILFKLLKIITLFPLLFIQGVLLISAISPMTIRASLNIFRNRSLWLSNVNKEV